MNSANTNYRTYVLEGQPANTPEKYWMDALVILKREQKNVAYQLWIEPLRHFKIADDDFILIAPDKTSKETIELRYLNHIIQAVRAVSGKNFDVIIITPDEVNNTSYHSGNRRSAFITNLKSKYIFETFVKGKSNELAFAAAVAVAEAPGKTRYNPLFLYGGVGLGKTHLMHSIGNYIILRDPDSKVLYVSAENLMNEFINSLKERKNQEFRDKFRNVDVLLVDDIQFLTDKEGTQEEFFHTFNALYYDNKQIVISSDKPPSELKKLEERLTSRFGSGLTVDITMPDFETRTAILEKKAELDHIKVPSEVIHFIARRISSNIRELEGALTKVTAFAKLTGLDVSLALAEKALKDIAAEAEKPEITVAYIQQVCGSFYGFTPELICSKNRAQELSLCRHIAMYLSRMLVDKTLIKIGKEFGGRDHTTVIHACDKVADEMDRNDAFREQVNKIKQRVMG